MAFDKLGGRLMCYYVPASGCEKVKLDVTDEASIKAAFEEIYAKAGHVGMQRFVTSF